jgi:ABC-type multidrug transport system ATPase subunit
MIHKFKPASTMKRISRISFNAARFGRHYGTASKPPIIRINNGTFYRHHPASITPGSHVQNPPLFKDLNFEIPSFSEEPQFWSVLGPSNAGKTTLLSILRGQHLCLPPTARSFPYLSSEEIDRKDHRLTVPSKAIKYVGFGEEQIGGASHTGKGAYLSARYESRREITDWSVLDFLKGNTELNPSGTEEKVDEASLRKVMQDLNLVELADMPVSNLSNGQTRRAKIAKALLDNPEVSRIDPIS